MPLTIQFFSRIDSYFEDAFGAPAAVPGSDTATRIVLTDSVTGLVTELTGTGLDRATGAGTVTGIKTVNATGGTVLTATGLAWPLGALMDAAAAHAGGNDSGLAALFSLQDVTIDTAAATGAARLLDFAPTARIDITGTVFDDTLSGGSAADTLRGGPGEDALSGLTGTDLLIGGRGNDTLLGAGGDDSLHGQRGNDHLSGGGGNDALFGGDAFDFLAGGAGADTLDGGAGYDLADYSAAWRAVAVDLGAGIGRGEGADLLIGIEDVDGSAFADRITGDGGDNVLAGNAGNDTLLGGGAGDTLYGDAGRDVLLLQGGSGEEAYGGAGNDRLVDDAGTAVLAGDGGNDTLRAGGGQDTLDGGTGDDRLSGGGGADRFVFTGTIGSDTVTDFRKGTDRLALDANLWTVELTTQQVVWRFATDTGADILFDFGNGATILLEDVAWRGGLHLDIDIL